MSTTRGHTDTDISMQTSSGRSILVFVVHFVFFGIFCVPPFRFCLYFFFIATKFQMHQYEKYKLVYEHTYSYILSYIDDTILNNSHPLTPVSSLKLFDTIVVNKQLHIIFYNFEVIVNIPT